MNARPSVAVVAVQTALEYIIYHMLKTAFIIAVTNLTHNFEQNYNVTVKRVQSYSLHRFSVILAADPFIPPKGTKVQKPGKLASCN